MKEPVKEPVAVGFHGDLQFMQVAEVPADATELSDGTLHRSSQSSANDHIVTGDFHLFEKGEAKYLVARDAVVTMREAKHKHADVPLKDSTWEIIRGRETDHIGGVIRKIAD
jgi:hypothetical protein